MFMSVASYILASVDQIMLLRLKNVKHSNQEWWSVLVTPASGGLRQEDQAAELVPDQPRKQEEGKKENRKRKKNLRHTYVHFKKYMQIQKKNTKQNNDDKKKTNSHLFSRKEWKLFQDLKQITQFSLCVDGREGHHWAHFRGEQTWVLGVQCVSHDQKDHDHERSEQQNQK